METLFGKNTEERCKGDLNFFRENIYLKYFIDKRNEVQFSHAVVSDSLRPHGLQHARPPCPLPTPGVYSDSCLLSR